MDQENSSASSSSFEDLAHLNENEMKEAEAQGLMSTERSEAVDAKESSSKDTIVDESFMDILGNGQLTKQILVKGEEEVRPMHLDWCKVSFVGKLDDGTVVDQATDMELHLGDNEVVQGLDMALALMNQGEKAEVKVNARFAYGELGLVSAEPDNAVIVPPNVTVTYEVELLDFHPVDPDEPRSFEERKSVGTRKKERGNYWFKRNEYNLAIQLYRKAIEYFDENLDSAEGAFTGVKLTNTELQELLEQRMVVYTNLAAAQTKIDALEAAMKSVETVLTCQPNNVKALYRKGKLLDAKGETNEAISVFQKAATLDPENKSFQNELSKLILKRSREQRNERNLYQKMLGQAQKLEQKKPPVVQQTPQESNWKWHYLLGSILIGVAGVALYRYSF